MTKYRKERVADLVLGFVASELRQLRDPRLQFVTLTECRMSPDLKVAKLYWTTHSAGKEGEFPQTSKADVASGTKALEGVVGLLRKRIAEELELRYLPELNFFFDDSIDRGMRIDYLLDHLPKGG